jgi:hypothetical protein
MIGLFDWLKIGAGAALGAVVAAGPVYLYGKREGRQAERVAQLEADVDAFVKRKGIDDEVDGIDRYRICIDLRGLPDECERLRGVDETPGGE